MTFYAKESRHEINYKKAYIYERACVRHNILCFVEIPRRPEKPRKNRNKSFSVISQSKVKEKLLIRPKEIRSDKHYINSIFESGILKIFSLIDSD